MLQMAHKAKDTAAKATSRYNLKWTHLLDSKLWQDVLLVVGNSITCTSGQEIISALVTTTVNYLARTHLV